MQARIVGGHLPVLEMALSPGDKIIAETGQLSWMTAGIELNTTHATAGTSSFLGASGGRCRAAGCS
ncbi:MAG: AIM24 family protein [Rhodospirillales bacterium]